MNPDDMAELYDPNTGKVEIVKITQYERETAAEAMKKLIDEVEILRRVVFSDPDLKEAYDKIKGIQQLKEVG